MVPGGISSVPPKPARESAAYSRDALVVLQAVRDQYGYVLDFAYELVNDAAESGAGPLQGQRFSEVPPGTPPDLMDSLRQVLDAGEPWSTEIERGSQAPTVEKARFALDVLPLDTDRLVCQYRDVTAVHERQEWLAHQAGRDVLTGLPNRRLFTEHLEVALAGLRRQGRSLAVAFCDVDQFKLINNTHGHAVGDELLVQIASRLHLGIRPGDVVARFGGDEFALLFQDLDDEDTPMLLAERVRALINHRYRLGAVEVVVNASMGVTSTSTFRNSEELLGEADTAVYEAKRRGRAKLVPFTAALRLRSCYRLETENDLHGALADGQFELYYQPVFDLTSGTIVGAEALLRWNHPRRGLLLPGEFLEIAEGAGHMTSIGAWALVEACGAAQGWSSLAAQPPRVMVNLSARQLADPMLPEHVLHALAATQLDPGRLELEVTESQVLTELVETGDLLLRLSEVGVRIALDDFGTGYSSLSWLQQLPVTTVKLDRSFVQEITSSAQNLAIVRAVIDLSHALGLQIIAEGIEDETQRELLKDIRAGLGQGFHLGRPMPLRELDALVSASGATGEARTAPGRVRPAR
jgi:diguanylate cyclase (GGDEF)-like protein